MARARDLAGADVPQDRHDAEGDEEEQAVPLGADGQTEEQARQPAVGAPPQEQGVRDVRVGAHEAVGVDRQRGREFLPCPVAVDDQAGERGQHEEHQHTVEQRGPCHHEGQAVHGHQRARQAAQERGAEDTAAHPAHDQHRQRPQQRRHEAPAERVEPEHQLAESDDVLADRRVHDIGGVRRERNVPVVVEDQTVDVLVPAELEAAVDERPRVLGVVRLVEYHLLRAAQVPEPHQPRHQRHQQRPEPARPARDPLGERPGHAQDLPHPRTGLDEGRHQALTHVASGLGRVAETAQPLLPRRPPVLGGLVLPGVRGGRGTGHRAIVRNGAV